MSRYDTAPAIRRYWSQEDSNAELIGCHFTDVTFQRGFGDSGKKIETIEMDCPHEHCESDRMVRKHRVTPVDQDTVLYWCLYPGCPHFVADELDHFRRTKARTTTVRGEA